MTPRLKHFLPPVIAIAISQALVQGCAPSPKLVMDAGDGSLDVNSEVVGRGDDPSKDAGADKLDGAIYHDDAGGDSLGDVPLEAPATSPPTDCERDPERCAFCTGKYLTVPLNETQTIRGTWQYNPGGAFVTLPAPGYPCSAFLYDGPVRPPLDDDHWVAAPDGALINFSTTSTLMASNYTNVQFRYFRSLVFIPASVTIDSFRVTTAGVDDSVRLVLYNSKYPMGVSPTDVGPSDPSEPAAGACAGNGDSAWDFKAYAQAGEINVVLVTQADMSPTVSSLGKTDITVNGAPIPLYDCVTGTDPTAPDAGAER